MPVLHFLTAQTTVRFLTIKGSRKRYNTFEHRSNTCTIDYTFNHRQVTKYRCSERQPTSDLNITH